MPDHRARALKAACAAAFLWAAPTWAAAQTPQIDATVRPGDDFYGYANGDWLRRTTLPQGRTTYDTTAMLRDQASRRIRALIEEAAAVPASDRARRVGDYYASWMDVEGIELKGLRPLADDLAAIAAIGDRRALSAYLGGALRLDDGSNTRTDGLFGVWIHQGFHDGDRNAPHLVQGGLGLADPDAYGEGPDAVQARTAYRAHVAATFAAAGFDQAQVRAGRVLALETAIAATHASRADTDDVFKTDNSWRRADFATKAPGMDWAVWLEAAGLDRQDEFVVWQPSAVIGAAALVGSQPIEAWRDYLAFHLIEHYAGALPAAFGGTAPDRAKQALEATTEALGQDIGQLYVARWFPPRSKAAAVEMVETIRTAFRARIAGLDWMSPAARAMSLAKLETLKVGVGYPDVWIDYAGLEVRRDDALGNMRRAEAFYYRRALAKLNQPVDPGEWSLVVPQWPGAVLNFSPNSMQFSAGLLQPPYFDPDGDAASNYGSAGAGMAHEISHTFDDLGGIYDEQGRLIRWRTPDDAARSQAATAALAAQLDADCPRPGLCVNGRQVLRESVADLAGVLAAHDAYVLSLGGKPDGVKDGLTGDQRFYLAFARRWRQLQTDAALGRQIAADTHLPGQYRADTVRNLDDWVRAFDVQPGDRLYLAPGARAPVW